jgi:CBS domain-containing protein
MNTIRDVLNAKPREIYSISRDATVFDALTTMNQKEIGALVVMEAGKVVGIVSERDYARKIILKGKTSRETYVRDVMSSDLYHVKPDNTVHECMVLMTGKHVRHLPVFEEEQFVGIVSIGDIVKSVIAEKDFLIDQLSNYIAGNS